MNGSSLGKSEVPSQQSVLFRSHSARSMDGDSWDRQNDAPGRAIKREMLKRGVHRWSELDLCDQVSIMRMVCQRKRHVILPDSRYMERWDSFMLLLLVYTCVVTPFEVTFLEPGLNVLFCVNRCVDAAFLKDMIMQFFLAYKEDAEVARSLWVTNLQRIRRRYLQKWFVLDLLSVLSSLFDIFSILFQSQSLKRMQAVRVIRIARLLKLFGVLKTSRICSRWFSRVEISYASVQLMRWTLQLIMTAHFTACVWTLVAFLTEDADDHSNPDSATWIAALEASKGATFDRNQPFSIYNVALYWSLMTITSIGYGDITAQSQAEYAMATLIMLLGSCMWAHILGSACAAVTTLDSERMHHEQRMDSVLMMSRDRHLPVDLRRRLRGYFQQSRRMHRIAMYREITDYMSPALRGEVSLQVTRKYLKRINFLHQAEDEFVVSLAKVLSLHLFPPNEWVVPEDSRIAKTTMGENQMCSFGLLDPHPEAPGDLDWLEKHAPPMTIMERGLASRHTVLCPGAVWHEDTILMSRATLRDPLLAYSLSFCSVYTVSHAIFFSMLDSGHFPLARAAVHKASVRLAIVRLMLRAAFQVKKAGQTDCTLGGAVAAVTEFEAETTRKHDIKDNTQDVLAEKIADCLMEKHTSQVWGKSSEDLPSLHPAQLGEARLAAIDAELQRASEERAELRQLLLQLVEGQKRPTDGGGAADTSVWSTRCQGLSKEQLARTSPLANHCCLPPATLQRV